MYQPPFSLKEQLPPRVWRSQLRPTITGLIISPHGKIVMVLPRKASANGWIFPQGGFQRAESPLLAITRELREELGYGLDCIDAHALQPLLTQACQHSDKRHYVVAVPLRAWQPPRLNGKNRKYCLVGGPNELWQKIQQCSPGKRELITRSIKEAMHIGLLHTERWHPVRADSFLAYAATT